MRRELDSLSLSLSFPVCLSYTHGCKPVKVHTHLSLLNGHRELPVGKVNKVAGGLNKNSLFCKTVSSSLLWISLLPFHTVPDVDCSYNRKQGERAREAEKRKAACQSVSLSKSNQQRECLASCRPLIMALG